ncbi:outer membrane lipoprotein carrier protein LolA [Planomonospora corallina]|uniref:Outer membrane lipoprotein carrier protein LolA n=1 Tax=Planomonospora corallina TaxID=1806052 RepID=A0ABV8I762_9ACTN
MSERTRRRGRTVRWGVPVAAIAVVAGAIGAGPVIAAVQGDPVLPERTAEQLLADAVQAARSGPDPMSGTLVQTSSLGLPGLPQVPGAGGSSPATLLAGSHELKVWYGGADRVRLALPGRMSETDLIVNGDQVWLWESEANTATRITAGREVLAEHRPGGGTLPGPGSGSGNPGNPGNPGDAGDAGDRAAESLPAAATPQQIAREVLERAGADTAISVTDNEKVAGRDAYQLTLAPKDDASLVREIRLALDGETLVPLRVQVYADGSAEPAFEVGFTTVTFSAPAPEHFAFTPPPGAKVEEKPLADLVGDMADRQEKEEKLAGEAEIAGEGWTAVAVLPFSERELRGLAQGGKDGGEAAEDGGAVADALLKSAEQVSGAWGSGRVVRTKLVSALLTDDGRLLVGAVTPERLIEVAGQK